VCDLTVEPPEDQGTEPSVFEGLIGTGVQRVLINKNGKWVVTLNMENKISHTAVITIQGGLMILVR
jgi:hypothetical protein